MSPMQWRFIALLACAPRAWTTSSRKDAQAHIECYVCNLMVHEANEHKKNNKLIVEDDVADMIDGLCQTKRKEGRWVTSIDIEMDKDKTLKIVKQADVGHCRKECGIARSACETALEDQEDDLKTMLLEDKAVPKMQKALCKSICKPKAKGKLPKLVGWEDEEFKAKHASIVQQEDMMPPGMQTYNANDILSMTDSDQKAFFADQEWKMQVREARARAEA
mmetsp:Transcript_57299/g.100358  ORF Transcript_57299/g.100358 Transcript_57299/m.100358 type:complete len:220 (+) Transcript_57299:82-741(+)